MEPTGIKEREDLARRDLDLIATYGARLRILDARAGTGLFAAIAGNAGFVSVPFGFSFNAARNWLR
jgi:hypothetical protein